MSTSPLTIHEPSPGLDMYYVYQDVAALIWPGDYDYDNHDAQARIIKLLTDLGCTPAGHARLDTPFGPVQFDSECGGCEFHADERGPVEYVAGVILSHLQQRAALREALA